MNSSTTTEELTYCAFGIGRVLILQMWSGVVADLNNRLIGGRLREVRIYQEGGEPFTENFLLKNQFNSLDDLVDFWQDPANSVVLRSTLSNMLYRAGSEGFEFHFRPVATDDGDTISVIVGDSTGMSRARKKGLVS